LFEELSFGAPYPRLFSLSPHALVDGYVIEGHVPAEDIRRLLSERPAVAGLAVAGMPASAPGMGLPGAEPQPYATLSFDTAGATSIYQQH